MLNFYVFKAFFVNLENIFGFTGPAPLAGKNFFWTFIIQKLLIVMGSSIFYTQELF